MLESPGTYILSPGMLKLMEKMEKITKLKILKGKRKVKYDNNSKKTIMIIIKKKLKLFHFNN